MQEAVLSQCTVPVGLSAVWLAQHTSCPESAAALGAFASHVAMKCALVLGLPGLACTAYPAAPHSMFVLHRESTDKHQDIIDC